MLSNGRFVVLGIILVIILELSYGRVLYEGDLMLNKDDYTRLKHGGLSRGFAPAQPWPNGIIPYQFDSEIAGNSKGKKEIINAINEWMSKTCIKFVPRTNQNAFITFVKDNNGRCASYGVGYYGYSYKVVLAERCWYQGMIVHELGHVIGFEHEHTRPDRDKYITIKWNNIKDGRRFDFEKSSGDSLSYTTPYDYASIMHYGAGFASKNGDTIVPLRSGVTMGDWKYLTQLDVMQAQILYKCPGKFVFSKIICEGNTDSILCYARRKIQITFANYGRRNMLKCSFFPWASCSSDQLSKLKSLCDGKSRCDVTASDAMFGDPCWAAKKYLELEYKCLA
ncbi:astacin-like metalloprotease toxin 2 [Actinia tenebrosa]|uniref:Metalloendopeptidase n=1 Tax=Actinia tenebrosa TaxID=6105 RepID=A0A6P8IM71_ACTTE|nr:astacin-like metalloprotease toxin 2 [Actinia tenebrosa]